MGIVSDCRSTSFFVLLTGIKLPVRNQISAQILTMPAGKRCFAESQASLQYRLSDAFSSKFILRLNGNQTKDDVLFHEQLFQQCQVAGIEFFVLIKVSGFQSGSASLIVRKYFCSKTTSAISHLPSALISPCRRLPRIIALISFYIPAFPMLFFISSASAFLRHRKGTAPESRAAHCCFYDYSSMNPAKSQLRFCTFL